jgi:outer membrane protein assembly factor BamB
VITASTAARMRSAWRFTEGSYPVLSPAIAGGVVYQAVNGGNAMTDVDRLVALDVRTGKRLWQITLPGLDPLYVHGSSLEGDVLVLPFSGYRRPAGITAVNVRTRKVLWSRRTPPSTDPGIDDGPAGPAVVDAGRVHLLSGDNLSAYDLRTGRLLWHKAPPGSWGGGMAASGGKLYTSSSPSGGDPSLVVYDGRTGRKLWSAPGIDGRPVVAGSLVVAPAGSRVLAFAGAGCGRSTCRPRWSRSIPGAEAGFTRIGGAAGSTVFLIAGNTSEKSNQLIRLHTPTGRVQWTVKRVGGATIGPPVRAADTVWLFDDSTTIKGWSATGSATKSLRTIAVPPDDRNTLGALSVAGGTLLHSAWPRGLVGYRIRGR